MSEKLPGHVIYPLKLYELTLLLNIIQGNVTHNLFTLSINNIFFFPYKILWSIVFRKCRETVEAKYFFLSYPFTKGIDFLFFY